MISYWEQQSFTYYHHIIAGAGLVGLSTALELKSLFPNERVLVLERGLLPTGATTRNAGFACMGSLTEILDDLETIPKEEVLALFLKRKQGLDKLRQRLDDKALDYRADGAYELIAPDNLQVVPQLEKLNALLHTILGQNAFKPATERIESFGFSKEKVAFLIENTCEGSINSGKMMRHLTDLCLQQGIEIKTGAAIERFEEEDRIVAVFVKDPFRQELLQLRCDTFSVCTNAFAPQLLPDEDVVPGRGQVLITEPLAGLPFKGIYHFDKGFYYFRELDGRVLFGGGRNLDFNGETTTEFELNALIQQDLDQKLSSTILPGVSFKVAQRWSGIMAFGKTKTPVIRAFSNRVYGAFRMGGMGVSLGSQAAADLARLVSAHRP